MVAFDQLAPASIDWAMAHIGKFGDTDIFPVPFEFKAIKDSWKSLKTELHLCNLDEFRPRAPLPILVPKSRTGFRAALQLDPLDALVYAALLYEAAGKIEKYRVPARRKIACSFRVQMSDDGSIFERQNGWPVYHGRSVDLANSGKFTHVLVADIADFYNQISHHRINNALQSAGIEPRRADNIEAFLSKLSARQSRGLPVGPSASIILAEASLDDVDKFLLSEGLPFLRYVDDFRIFCRSERQAVETAHALTEYLYTAHRLVLTGSKTRLYSVKKFISSELLDPEEQEEAAKVNKLKSLIDEVLENTGYDIDFEDVPGAELNKITRDNLGELFEGTVGTGRLNLGLTRYLLRRATHLRTTVLHKMVLDNLAKLAPVMREVIGYLSATLRLNGAETLERAVVEHLDSSSVGSLPFVRLWGLELLIRLPVKRLYSEAMRIAEDSQAELGVRPSALLAMAHGQVQWVRARKEKWANHAPWDRRAIIWSARILPQDERRHWCSHVKDTASDPLDKAVAILASRG